MASMVAKVNNNHLSSLSIQSKGTRNKRKFRTDHTTSDLNKVVTSPLKDGSSYKFSAEKVEGNSSHKYPTGPCDMCGMCQGFPSVVKLDKGLSNALIEGLCTEGIEGYDFQDADWSELTEGQLEELVLSNLDALFRSAIKKIVGSGFTEEAATKAVLRSGLCYGSKDTVSNIVDNAMVVLRSGQNINSSAEHCFRDLQQLEKYVLAELVCVLRGVRPFFSTGDAMWSLLICDMNVSHACAMDCDCFNTMIGQCCSHVSSCNPTQLPFKPESESGETNLPIPCKPISAVPCAPASQSSTAVPTNLTEPKKSNKDCATSCSHSHLTPLEKPYSAGMSQTRAVDEKFVGGRKMPSTGSKKEHALRQKSPHSENTYRINGTNDICKTARLYGYILDQRGKAMADSCCLKSKNACRKSNKHTVDVCRESGSVSISTKTSQSSASATITKGSRRTISQSTITIHNFPTPAVKAKPLVSLGDSELSCPSPMKSDSRQVSLCVNSEAPNSGYAHISHDKSLTMSVPQNKKDEMIMKLIPRVQELKIQLEEWTEWANHKVMQAAQRLGKDKAELKILRQEKEEVERLKKEKQTLQENTMKKLAEMENALGKASGQIERANAAARRLKVENSSLRLELEAAKLRAAESLASCQEVSRREKKTLMESQSWEREKSIFQEELASERRKLSQLQQQLEQARDRQTQLMARWKQEEKTKDDLLTRASSLRKEREQLEFSAKSKGDATILKAEANLQKYKGDISKLENEISELRMKTDASKIAALKRGIDGSYANTLTNSQNAPVLKEPWDSYQPGNLVQDFLGVGGVTRERECVMCLTEEMSVVFLPCAHQVVCKKCNELHEKQGMNDCPSCRCPIMRRICVRYARS